MRNDLPICAIPNSGFCGSGLHVLEVDEDALRGLRARCATDARVFTGPTKVLNIKLSGASVKLSFGAAVGTPDSGRVIGAKALLAVPAVDSGSVNVAR